nr:uncharacterized protein LOC111855790 [Paramormyrops kingsleyae]
MQAAMTGLTLSLLLLPLCAADVFLRPYVAHSVLHRPRRANTGLLEELKQGNLERECIEEVCDYEEAREVFEDDTLANRFWTMYRNRNPCDPNPCLNNGKCVHFLSIYQCQCPDGFQGRHCQEAGVAETLKCRYLNGGCEHFCNDTGGQVTCACADGHAVAEDGRSCVAEVQYPCGKVPLLEASKLQANKTTRESEYGQYCPKGHCPWQVLLQHKGSSYCGGVIVHPSWVVTTAHCLINLNVEDLMVVAGEHDLRLVEGTEQKIRVAEAVLHELYNVTTSDSNIALLRLHQPIVFSNYAAPVCLPRKEFAENELVAMRYSIVSGWGCRIKAGYLQGDAVSLYPPTSRLLWRMAVPPLSPEQCALKSGMNLTSNMFCAGYLEGTTLSSCKEDNGSPLVTRYGDTAFLTGLVGFRACTYQGYFKIYTKVSNFLDWLHAHMSSGIAPTDGHPHSSTNQTLPPVVIEQHSPSDPFWLWQRGKCNIQLESTMFCFIQAGLLLLSLLPEAETGVFLQNQDANQVLSRRRRANSLFEEFKKGDMERECIEERCSREEAREIFENEERTNEFWNVYVDGDSCRSVPCINNGTCKDGIGSYTCYCAAGFQGTNCEIAIPKLCDLSNGDCEHFCNVVHNHVICSCADGYTLGEDRKSCLSNEPFKCGFIVSKHNTRSIKVSKPLSNATQHQNISASNTTVESSEDDYEDEELINDFRVVGGEECPAGDCPWQALLVTEDDLGFCGGTILNQKFILTAAHCLRETQSFYVVLGETNRNVDEHRETRHEVELVLVHSQYMPDTYHNDIALVKMKEPIRFSPYILPACLPESDFAERVLMRQPDGMVSGFGRVREGGPQSPVLLKLSVPYVDRKTCIDSSNLKISNTMFCAGYSDEAKDACQGDSGGPHVTRYKNTWFLTGVVSWGEGCARRGKYGIYTQVSKYIKWIRAVQRKYIQL